MMHVLLFFRSQLEYDPVLRGLDARMGQEESDNNIRMETYLASFFTKCVLFGCRLEHFQVHVDSYRSWVCCCMI